MVLPAADLELRLPPPLRRTPPYVARVPMSAEQFIDWDHGNRLADWVDGEAFLYMTTTNEHERILMFLTQFFGTFCAVTGAGLIRRGPFAMRVTPRGSVREPDLLFIANENLNRLTEKLLAGRADLVVEVISDDSPVRDRRTKFREYQDGGVREYWVIDSRPRRRTAEFFVLHDGDSGRQLRPAPVTDDGEYRSTVLPELVMNTAWLWSDTQTALQRLTAMLGRDRVVAALG